MLWQQGLAPALFVVQQYKAECGVLAGHEFLGSCHSWCVCAALFQFLSGLVHGEQVLRQLCVSHGFLRHGKFPCISEMLDSTVAHAFLAACTNQGADRHLEPSSCCFYVWEKKWWSYARQIRVTITHPSRASCLLEKRGIQPPSQALQNNKVFSVLQPCSTGLLHVH